MTDLIVDAARRECPAGWEVISVSEDGVAYQCRVLRVIVSTATELDGQRWKHVSVSRRNRCPDYGDLNYVRRTFCSPDNYVAMVLPPDRYHVNLHPFCLHLFECLGEWRLPEFSRGKGTI